MTDWQAATPDDAGAPASMERTLSIPSSAAVGGSTWTGLHSPVGFGLSNRHSLPHQNMMPTVIDLQFAHKDENPLVSPGQLSGSSVRRE